jgi:cytochrome b561
MKANNVTMSWNATSKALHWLGAMLILFLLAHGWWMKTIAERTLRLENFSWHASVGYSLLTLLIVRMLWRWASARPEVAASAAAWERWTATAGHIGLYLLMLAMTLSGWALAGTFTQPLDASLLGLIDVPAITSAPNHDLHVALEEWHALLAWPLTALIVVHILAAFYHHLIKRDDVMRSMLPLKPRS